MAKTAASTSNPNHDSVARLAFLEQAGKLLSSSLDFRTTLKHIADLAVPTIADWCAVDLCQGDYCDDPSGVQRLAVSHVDPAKIQLAYDLEAQYPADPDAPGGVLEVIRTRKSQFIAEIPPEMLMASAKDERHAQMLAELGLVSAIVVPLKVQDTVLGALTLVTAESGRIMDEADLSLCEDLASRAAVAIDHANLLRRMQDTELKLRDQLAYTDVVMQSVGEGIYTVDTDGGLVYMNARAEELLGWKLDELKGKNVQEAIHYLDANGNPVSADGNPLAGVLKNGQPYESSDDVFVTKSGALLPVEYTSTPIRTNTDVDGNGASVNGLSSITGAVLAFHDITERKRFGAELIAQREWYEVTLSSIGDAVMAADVSGKITFINAACEVISGWKREEALGRPLEEVFKIVNEDSHKPVENPFEKVMKTGAVVGLANHTLLLTKDGSETPIDDSAAPIRDQHGNVIGVVLVFQDITDRKRLENFQMRSQQRMSKILDSIGDAFVSFDMSWAISYANTKAVEILAPHQSEPGNPVGKVFWALFPDLIWSDLYERFHDSMRTQKPAVFEWMPEQPAPEQPATAVPEATEQSEAPTPSGNWFAVTAYPAYDGLSVFFRDITDRKNIELKAAEVDKLGAEYKEQQRVRDAEYQQMIDLVPQMIWTADPNGELTFVNKRVYEYSGLEASDTVGWGWLSILHPDDVEPTMATWRNSLATGEGYSVNFRLKRHSDQEYRLHLGRAVAIKNGMGKVTQWFGTCTDIEDEKNSTNSIHSEA